MANCKPSPELYDIRYAPNWLSEIRPKAMRSTRGRCCLCGCKAEEVHHAMYKDDRGPVLGSEKPGIHVFPLCKKCHKRSHSRHHWIYDSVDPLFGNRNTKAFLRELRAGYLSKMR